MLQSVPGQQNKIQWRNMHTKITGICDNEQKLKYCKYVSGRRSQQVPHLVPVSFYTQHLLEELRQYSSAPEDTNEMPIFLTHCTSHLLSFDRKSCSVMRGTTCTNNLSKSIPAFWLGLKPQKTPKPSTLLRRWHVHPLCVWCQKSIFLAHK